MTKPSRPRYPPSKLHVIAYLYVLGASRDPNQVECSVPFEVDAEEIFFGPCKKNLRQRLRKQYLRDRDDVEPEEDIYLIGFNGLGSDQERRIVWVGRIKRVRPLRNAAGELLGYEHRSDLHPKDWAEDVAVRDSHKVRLEGERVLIAPGETAFSAFPRDCCFLLENVFTAAGAGIPIDDAVVEVLRNAQPDKDTVSAVAPFGLQVDGDIEGKQGWWLPLEGALAEMLIELLPERIESARTESMKSGRRPATRAARTCSCTRMSASECEENDDAIAEPVTVRRC